MKHLLLTICITSLLITLKSQTINSFPYFTGFEGAEGTLNYNFPPGWIYEDLNTNTFGNECWQIIKNSPTSINARTDSTAVHMYSNMSQNNNDWLFTPGIQMTAGLTYTLSFWYNTMDYQGTTEKLKVHIGTGSSSTEMSLEELWDNNLTNTEYQQANISYTPSTNDIYYFGFHCYSDAMQFILFMDDITIDETNTTGIDRGIETDLFMYPNPCDNFLNISTKSPDKLEKKKVKVFNLSGQLVVDDSFSGKSYFLNTEVMPNGIYIVNVIEGAKMIYNKQIIVKH